MNLTETKKTFWINSFFISIVYFFLRRDAIRSSSLDLDEMLTWKLVQMPWKDFFSTIYHDTQQPLYYILLKIINILIPLNNDVLLRYPSLFIGLATLLLFFHYGSRYFNQLTVLIGVLFLLCHQEFKYLSFYARPYSLFYFLIFLNVFSLLEIFYKDGQHQKRHKQFFLITSILMCLTHYLSYFYFFTLLISLAILKRKVFWRHLGKFKIIGLALFSVAYISVTSYQYQFKHYLNWIPDIESGLGHALRDAFNPSPTLPLTLTFLLRVFFIVYLFRQFSSHNKERAELLFLLSMQVFGVLLFAVFSKVFFSVFIAKYLLIFLPFTVLLFCHFAEFWCLKNRAGFSFLVVAILISFKGFEKNEYAWKLDAKIFLSEISHQKLLAPGVSVLCNTPNIYPHILSNYSEYFFQRNICSDYRAHELEPFKKGYNYIINIKAIPKDAIYNQQIKDFHVLYSSRDLELLVRN